MNRFVKNILLYLLVIIAAVTIFDMSARNESPKSEIAFSSLVKQVQEKNVDSIVITNDHAIVGKFKNGTEFSSYAPTDPTLVNQLIKNDVDVKAKPAEKESWWVGLLSQMLPILLLIGAWFFIMQQTQGGGGKVMNFGKSKAKKLDDGVTSVTFKDVAGAEEAKEELSEIVDFLKEPKKFAEIGAKIPKGVLLYGPPGTGKTLLAKAVAGEAGVPFFTISGSDFVEMFVGVGASRVRDLFNQAKKNAPCIIFIDEIDAVGRQRGAGLGGGHDEREQTLNQLLVEMDGFGSNQGIITIAATNRPDILDPALLRPGRFDRQVAVGKPDLRGRIAILKVHTRNKPIADDVKLDIIAKKTPGFTGADLANIVNEAALLAARHGKKLIDMAEFEEASEKVSMGPERRSHIVNEKEQKITAYHESGHAIVAYLLDEADPVHKVTIVPRGQAGGYTLMLPEEERNYYTKSQLLAQIRVALGGRCAEAIIFNEISSGASGDLQTITNIARTMITRYGMSDVLGPLVFGKDQDQVFLGKNFGHERDYGEAVAEQIDTEMRQMVAEAYEDVMNLLTDNIDFLHNMSNALLEVETIDSEIIDNLYEFGTIENPNKKELPTIAQELVDAGIKVNKKAETETEDKDSEMKESKVLDKDKYLLESVLKERKAREAAKANKETDIDSSKTAGQRILEDVKAFEKEAKTKSENETE